VVSSVTRICSPPLEYRSQNTSPRLKIPGAAFDCGFLAMRVLC